MQDCLVMKQTLRNYKGRIVLRCSARTACNVSAATSQKACRYHLHNRIHGTHIHDGAQLVQSYVQPSAQSATHSDLPCTSF